MTAPTFLELMGRWRKARSSSRRNHPPASPPKSHRRDRASADVARSSVDLATTLMTFVSQILVPVDFSPGSRAAVKYAAILAQTLHSTVTLLHVYELPSPMSSIVPGADEVGDAENERAAAQRWLELLRTEAQKDSEIDIRVVVVHGAPVEEIVSLSREGGFDMVVMGTHGRTGFQHILMGSVAEAVVRRAPCPVLTIHLPVPSGPG